MDFLKTMFRSDRGGPEHDNRPPETVNHAALRYGLIGAGSAARLHLNDIARKHNVTLVGIADPLEPKGWRIAPEYANLRRFPDAESLLREMKPDLVSICTPNRFHRELTLQALSAGAHVACEKPMALTVAEATEMEQARAAAGRLGSINFKFRNLPAFRFARQLIASGGLGRVLRVGSLYLQGFQGVSTALWSWRNDVDLAGFGAMGDLGVHMIDTVRFLTRLEFDRVVGLTQTLVREKNDAAGARRAITTDTNAVFIAELSNSVAATFEATQVAPPYGDFFRVEISGELGTLAVHSEHPYSIWLRADPSLARQAVRNTDIPQRKLPAEFLQHQPPNSPGAIVDAIRGATVEFPNFADGLAAQQVLGALQESILSSAWAPVR